MDGYSDRVVDETQFACRVKLWSGNEGSGKEQVMHSVREGGNGPSGSERDCQ